MDFKKLSNSLFGGSLVLLITINIFNALNYFFHFFMARLLTPAEYGVLAVLMSIVAIFNIPSESIQTIISKFSTNEKSIGKIRNVSKRAMKKLFKYSLILFVIYGLISVFLSVILKISFLLLLFTGILLIATFLIPVTRGILQGRKKFNALGFNMIFESVIKISLAVLFVVLGFNVYGAIGGVLSGAFAALLLSFLPLRDVLTEKEKKGRTNIIHSYSWPITVTILVVMLFINLDILVAKAVFSPETAGYYAMASFMAKVIFFGTMPISKAMFPISSQHEKDKKKADSVLKQSVLIILFCIAVALAVIALFPELLIRIFAGRYVPQASDILLFTSIAVSLVSITNLILLQKISVGKVKGYFILLSFIIVELILLYTFSSNLVEFSLAFVTSSAIFLWGSIVLLK
jgi:O-antigen/teichoic acid export membrane protein